MRRRDFLKLLGCSAVACAMLTLKPTQLKPKAPPYPLNSARSFVQYMCKNLKHPDEIILRDLVKRCDSHVNHKNLLTLIQLTRQDLNWYISGDE